jgi:hypothetical protein
MVVGRGTCRTCLIRTDGLDRLVSEKSDATLVACVLIESSEEVELTSVSGSYPGYELSDKYVGECRAGCRCAC